MSLENKYYFSFRALCVSATRILPVAYIPLKAELGVSGRSLELDGVF